MTLRRENKTDRGTGIEPDAEKGPRAKKPFTKHRVAGVGTQVKQGESADAVVEAYLKAGTETKSYIRLIQQFGQA